MILVTGGTGLVGSHILYDLCKSGKKVRAIKRSTSNTAIVKNVFSYYENNVNALFNNIEWVNADITNIFSLIDVMDNIDSIYHCAAMVSFDPKEKENVLKINSEGTANIVDAAIEKNIKKLCYISSITTLANKKDNALTRENDFIESQENSSTYSISKQNAETEVWRGVAEGLDAIVLNPSVIIGGGNWQQSSSNMFSKAYKGLKFYTEGATGFVDVRDVSKNAIQLMDSDIVNEQYILNSENWTYKKYFDLIHTEFGTTKPSIKAGPILSSFAWRAEKVKSFLSEEPPLITKETALSAHNVATYSSKKILETFPNFKFITVEKSIKDTCKLYLNDN